MASSTDICVACGICCDGHLFDNAPMYPGEQPLCAALGMGTAEPADSYARYLLPCPRHSRATGCTVYERRPTTCRTFRCRLLQDHDAARVAGDEALAVIGKVRRLEWLEVLRPALLELVPDATGPVARHLMLAQQAIAASPDPGALRRRYGLVLLRTAALSKLLNDHFYTEERGTPAPAADGTGVTT